MDKNCTFNIEIYQTRVICLVKVVAHKLSIKTKKKKHLPGLYFT